MRLFLSGDYESLCRVYRLSGASGQQRAIHVKLCSCKTNMYIGALYVIVCFFLIIWELVF